ncbi:MAG TPA: 4Fe-4S dicluster-binding protein [Chlorobaculum sp.]|jgi:Pyruvate/2-oxoacid:ferredoxin oxidoreductase delta subunit|nr:4Fe-4S dicluster-binding protein [Chlorobaculum sp.]
MDTNEEILQGLNHSTPESETAPRKRAKAGVDIDLCTGCGICANVCPVTCVTIIKSELNFNGVSSVDQQRCTGCNICAIDCPWFAITMRYPDGTKKDAAEYEKQLQRLRGYR